MGMLSRKKSRRARERRRQKAGWAEPEGIAPKWTAAPNADLAPSRRARKARWVQRVMIAGLPVALLALLVAAAASNNANWAVRQTAPAEVVLPPEPEGTGIAADAAAAWLRAARLPPLPVVPSGFELAVCPGQARRCETHRLVVSPSEAWTVELVVTVDVDARTAGPVYAQFRSPPGEFEPGAPHAPAGAVPADLPAGFDGTVAEWVAAWTANDLIALRSLAGDTTGEVPLAVSGAPDGWIVDPATGVSLGDPLPGAEHGQVLQSVSFRLLPPPTDPWGMPAQLSGGGYSGGLDGDDSAADAGDDGSGSNPFLSAQGYASGADAVSLPVTLMLDIRVDGVLAFILSAAPVGASLR